MSAPTDAELASVVSMTADRLADEWPARVIANLHRAAQRLEAREVSDEYAEAVWRAWVKQVHLGGQREQIACMKRALEAVRDKP